MLLVRRLLKQLVIVVLAGFVVQKLLESSNPRARRIGGVANRLMGNRVPAHRRLARTRR